MSTAKSPLVSVILPVYNRINYLSQSISSVIDQTYQNWELLISDDASDINTQYFLEKYKSNSKIKLHHNHINVGLFANLNQAIERSQGDYLIFLCSDDILDRECLDKCINLVNESSQVQLILSAFIGIDATGNKFPSAVMFYYEKILSQPFQVFESCEFLPLLLQYGSINGNLTGIFCHRSVFNSSGYFDEKYKQVGDWEWLYRVAKVSPILMSKEPIAFIRNHSEQLSGVNFVNATNSLEVVDMIKKLLADPLISKLDNAPCWARYILHFHFWYALKLIFRGYWKEALKIIVAVNQVVSLPRILLTLISWLPERWKMFKNKTFALPPS